MLGKASSSLCIIFLFVSPHILPLCLILLVIVSVISVCDSELPVCLFYLPICKSALPVCVSMLLVNVCACYPITEAKELARKPSSIFFFFVFTGFLSMPTTLSAVSTALDSSHIDTPKTSCSGVCHSPQI